MAKLKEQQYRIAAEAAHNAASTIARYYGGETRSWDELTVGEQNERWRRVEGTHAGKIGEVTTNADDPGTKLYQFQRTVEREALKILDKDHGKVEAFPDPRPVSYDEQHKQEAEAEKKPQDPAGPAPVESDNFGRPREEFRTEEQKQPEHPPEQGTPIK